MKQEINEVEINGVNYVRKDSITSKEPAAQVHGMEYVIVRTYSAGVFAGYLKSHEGKEVVLLNARRLWYWKGAASLSQLSEEGVKHPNDCKFPCEVACVTLIEAVEILAVTRAAQDSIAGVPVWKM